MSLTPAMKQYYEIKQQHPDAIVFFRMGDFYEMFDEDAQIAHKILGISLTSRNKNSENPTPLAGIPYHAKDKYIPQLLAAGYKIAVAEQVTKAGSKGIIEREVTRIITPATAQLEENLSMETESSVLAGISQKSWKFGLSLIDLTSQNWKCYEFEKIEELLSFLYKFFPKEIVIAKNIENTQEIQDMSQKKFQMQISFFPQDNNAYEYLIKLLNVQNLIGFWIEKKPAAVCACAMTYQYLKQNQKSDFILLNHISFHEESQRMQLDENTIKNLDLVYNFATNSQTLGTLFWAIQGTKTPMGKRFLKSEILAPLVQKNEILERQEFIAALKQDYIVLEELREELKKISDLEIILSRLSLGRVWPRDLLNLKYSLIAIRNCREILKKSKNPILSSLL